MVTLFYLHIGEFKTFNKGLYYLINKDSFQVVKLELIKDYKL